MALFETTCGDRLYDSLSVATQKFPISPGGRNAKMDSTEPQHIDGERMRRAQLQQA
jgi:hypothetical protein